MKTGLSKFQSRVSVVSDRPADTVSPMCEIPGCDTHFVPASNGFPDRHERGLTATVVNDYGGVRRGICAEHYIRGLVKAGNHPNQNLMNSDGSMSPVLVKEHWARMGVEAAEKDARR